MNIQISLIVVFVLISIAMFLLLGLNPFAVEQNPLKKRRLYLTGAKLKITERIAIRFQTLFRQTGCTQKKYLAMTGAAAAGGFLAGLMLFNSAELAAVVSVCLTPAPFFYLTVKSATAAREEIEGLENTMSIITNAYAGCDDIIKAVETYVEEKNRYIPVQWINMKMRCSTASRTRIWTFLKRKPWAMKDEVKKHALCNTGAD